MPKNFFILIIYIFWQLPHLKFYTIGKWLNHFTQGQALAHNKSNTP